MEFKGFGFVEFESEADAEKVFDAYLRSKKCFRLKTRIVKVNYYRPPRNSKDGKHSTNKAADLTAKPPCATSDRQFVQTETTEQCGLTIDDLPNDILFIIFDRLSFEDFNALEQGK